MKAGGLLSNRTHETPVSPDKHAVTYENLSSYIACRKIKPSVQWSISHRFIGCTVLLQSTLVQCFVSHSPSQLHARKPKMAAALTKLWLRLFLSLSYTADGQNLLLDLPGQCLSHSTLSSLSCPAWKLHALGHLQCQHSALTRTTVLTAELQVKQISSKNKCEKLGHDLVCCKTMLQYPDLYFLMPFKSDSCATCLSLILAHGPVVDAVISKCKVILCSADCLGVLQHLLSHTADYSIKELTLLIVYNLSIYSRSKLLANGESVSESVSQWVSQWVSERPSLSPNVQALAVL